MKNVYFKNSQKMSAVKNNSVDLIITSPLILILKIMLKTDTKMQCIQKTIPVK